MLVRKYSRQKNGELKGVAHHDDMVPVSGPRLAVLWFGRRARLELEGDLLELGVQAASRFPAKRAA